MNYSHLVKYGLKAQIVEEAKQYSDFALARVVRQNRSIYDIVTEQGELLATVSGKLIHQLQQTNSYPAVGDWVLVNNIESKHDKAIIHHVLSRTSVFERKAAGTSRVSQVVAANIDKVFICMSLNQDFNVRRIERYLTVAWDSGATPIIVLTKADLCENVQHYLDELHSVSLLTQIIVCSTLAGDGIDQLSSYLQQGETIAFIGSSGVGKSTLINKLAGQTIFHTGDVREDDDKGRHTTTYRELIVLPSGAIVIDTPGMRELQLASGNLAQAFDDIEAMTALCKFSDCRHTKEPGCAILAAIAAGELEQSRFDSYRNLQIELSYAGLSSREIEHKKMIAMFGGKDQHKSARQYNKNKKK